MIGIITVYIFTSTTITAQIDYNWEAVKIGGGGYVTGIKIHPLDTNLIYLRTDVGGAYRWHPAEAKMKPLINHRNKNYHGVAGIALHPTDTGIIYLAVDMKNDPANAAILKSTDKGDNWQIIPTPTGVKFGANGGRVNSNTEDRDREGSPIAVNPQNVNELWIGSREKGLWKLNGTTWTRIAPNTLPDNDEENSIRNVLFHPNQPNYIFVAYYQHGIFRSQNGGSNFSLINGGNNDLNESSDLSFSKNGSSLFAACRNKGVYRLDNPTTSDNWINTFIPEASLDYGYLTVTASPHDDDIVVACPAGLGGNNFKRLYVSYDKGNNWIKKNDVLINSLYPWDSYGTNGNHTSQIAFDPVDPDKLYATFYAGMYHTDNWQAGQLEWINTKSNGHEEIVTTGCISFPENNNNNSLIVNSGDHTGWVIKNNNEYPEEDIRDLTTPSGPFKKGAGATVCEQFPNNVLVSSTVEWGDSDGYLLYSTNGGQSFGYANGYPTSWGKATMAMSSGDPNNIVLVCQDGVKYSDDYGATFNTASGIPGVTIENVTFFKFRPLVADPVDNHTFYIYKKDNGTVYKSTNKGQNWANVGSLPFTLSNESNSTRLTAAHGHEGHLWINHHNTGLYRSTNSGVNWNKIAGIKKTIAFAIGKEKCPTCYPTIYMLGQLTNDTASWFYRSTDEGNTWERISDESVFYLESLIRHMTADRTEFGKFYVGTTGMGVWSGYPAPVDTVASYIDIITPTSGEALALNSNYIIQWDDNLPDDVRIVLFKGGTYYNTLISSTESDGNYDWAIGDNLPVGDDYQIRIRSNANTDVDDYSDLFSIVEDEEEPPLCDLIPNGTFQNGDLSGWSFLEEGGATGSYSAPWNRAQISIENPGTEYWHLRLVHDDIYLEGGNTYELQYDAKAWGNRDISVVIKRNDNGEKLYSEIVPLNNQWDPRPIATFTMPVSGTINLLFRVGSNLTTIILDNITLNDVGCPNINMLSIPNLSQNLVTSKKYNEAVNIQAYPNPAQHILNFNLEITEEVLFDFYMNDAYGRTIYKEEGLPFAEGKQQMNIDISKLNNGCYFYHFITKEKQITGKFTVIK